MWKYILWATIGGNSNIITFKQEARNITEAIEMTRNEARQRFGSRDVEIVFVCKDGVL